MTGNPQACFLNRATAVGRKRCGGEGATSCRQNPASSAGKTPPGRNQERAGRNSHRRETGSSPTKDAPCRAGRRPRRAPSIFSQDPPHATIPVKIIQNRILASIPESQGKISSETSIFTTFKSRPAGGIFVILSRLKLYMQRALAPAIRSPQWTPVQLRRPRPGKHPAPAPAHQGRRTSLSTSPQAKALSPMT